MSLSFSLSLPLFLPLSPSLSLCLSLCAAPIQGTSASQSPSSSRSVTVESLLFFLSLRLCLSLSSSLSPSLPPSLSLSLSVPLLLCAASVQEPSPLKVRARAGPFPDGVIPPFLPTKDSTLIPKGSNRGLTARRFSLSVGVSPSLCVYSTKSCGCLFLSVYKAPGHLVFISGRTTQSRRVSWQGDSQLVDAATGRPYEVPLTGRISFTVRTPLILETIAPLLGT
jgi:hypothetical protein